MNSVELIALADELTRKALDRVHGAEGVRERDLFLPLEHEFLTLYDLGYRHTYSTRDLVGSGLDGGAILRREIVLGTLEPDERDFMCTVARVCLLAHEIGLDARDLFDDLVSRIRRDYRGNMRRLLQMEVSALARDFKLLRAIEQDGIVLVKMDY